MNNPKVVHLKPSKDFPRGIVIFWEENTLRLVVTDQKGWPEGKIIAHAFSRKPNEFCLHLYDIVMLSCASATFPLSIAEAEIVRREFEPLGLQVHRLASLSADPASEELAQ